MGVALDAEVVFRILADATRLRALMLLQAHGELCVCELTYALDIIQPKISRHLATLRQNAIVLDRRDGQWIYYRINPGLPTWAHETLKTVAAAVSSRGPYALDRKRLRQMPNRPSARRCA